jgi:hypothetical protein
LLACDEFLEKSTTEKHYHDTVDEAKERLCDIGEEVIESDSSISAPDLVQALETAKQVE